MLDKLQQNLFKKCSTCKVDKLPNEFYNSPTGKFGKMAKCIPCYNTYQNIIYSKTKNSIRNKRNQNRSYLNIQSNKIHKSYVKKWKEFFIQKYGQNPKCQICSHELSWTQKHNKKSFVVHFDHRSEGKELIRISPSRWYGKIPCTESNIKIWQECNFGILCNQCNKKLPTLGRLEWLHKALKYSEGKLC
jgi:hypothetical protein